ncbi:MAG TPA: UDP-2,3-diacylglucosamine diphosphatase [Bacteroidales bacterium]|nr:UDP-2,3-diacylglucosamine diphosphatase [Bacteroidales bacterium]HPO66539.1 UDP-2,3-diacylglucosamine diphosphatase [Bacteroidales bacterium]
MTSIQLSTGKKCYFASDFHLGLYPYEQSRIREKIIVQWLHEIANDAEHLFLLGDIFDFWYEYHKVAPRGFVRFLGKLADLADRGIQIHYFTGNHDVWVFDYLPAEINMHLYRNHELFIINHKKFLIGHGDGLYPGDWGYRFLKACFTSRVLQFLFSRLHPNLAFAIGHTWSKHSRLAKGVAEAFLGEDKEHQIIFARKYLSRENVDFFVFGHRHIPMDFALNHHTRLINTGEWIHSKSYAVFDGENMELKFYQHSL